MALINEVFSKHFLKQFYTLGISSKLAIVCICLLPIFHLTFNHWTGYLMVWASLFSLISLIQSKGVTKEIFQDPRSKWIILGLIAYTLSIFLSQLGRFSFNHKSYLDTSPFLYFVPIFIFVVWQRIDMGKWLQITLPIIILGAYWSTFYNHRELARADWIVAHRLAPYFSDPLAFGQIILSLGLMSLSTIDLNKINTKSIIISLWSLLGFCVGVSLSVESGSRTGWLAIPGVLFLILITKLNLNIWKSSLISLLLSVASCIFLYNISPMIQERMILAANEILTYPWQGGIAPDTSVGLRITFQRLGWFYFSQSPIYGWGTNGFNLIKDAPEVIKFSTQFARDFVNSALFHNELMTNMVRHGIFGIAAYVFAVLIPLFLALKNTMSDNAIVKRASLLCACFLICQIVAGFSDEFLNLKGMVAFYAYLISILFGTMISYSTIHSPSKAH